MFHSEGLQYLQEVALSGRQSKPANFYLGLASSAPSVGDSLGDVAEISGQGYARQAIPSDTNGFPTSQADGAGWEHVASQETFTAESGAGLPWTGATHWFLATTADDSGKLIASGALAATRTLAAAGDTEKVTATLSGVNGDA